MQKGLDFLRNPSIHVISKGGGSLRINLTEKELKMVKENNEMDAKTKLAIISGNIQAMEALLKDIKKRISSGKEGIVWQEADNDLGRVHCALGGLMGIEESINALKALAEASFCIGRR